MKIIALTIVCLICFATVHAQTELKLIGSNEITQPETLGLQYQQIIKTPFFLDFASRSRNNIYPNTLFTDVVGFQNPITGLHFIAAVNSETAKNANLFLPSYTQGIFCDFEDHINRKRQLRIDFSVK